MSLTEVRLTYKPFEYPKAYDYWKMQSQAYWTVDRFNMSDDVRDWKYNLTDKERNVALQILRFFTQGDVEVGKAYTQHYLKIFKPVEVQMMLTMFAAIESIHVDAYSHLNTTLGLPDTEYEAFLQYKEMKDKYEYINSFNSDNPYEIAKTMAVFGAFTEGMQLFSAFAILMNFPRHNRLKGMGQIVSYSVRDETIHSNAMAWLFKQWLKEHPEINQTKLETEVADICEKMVEHEDAFINLAFELGDIPGLSKDEVKQYIRYVADHRLVALGYLPLYFIKKHPLPWLEEIMNGVEFANFFEREVTEYSVNTTKGDWDDAEF